LTNIQHYNRHSASDGPLMNFPLSMFSLTKSKYKVQLYA
jgi:hypothetical protein